MYRTILTAVALALFSVGTVGAVAAGQSAAWTDTPPPVGTHVTDRDPDALADIADRAAQLTGTDAGLITEPAALEVTE